jgi:hypothetical protein
MMTLFSKFTIQNFDKKIMRSGFHFHYHETWFQKKKRSRVNRCRRTPTTKDGNNSLPPPPAGWPTRRETGGAESVLFVCRCFPLSRFSLSALLDKKVKTVGSISITNRASLGATIGEGNKHMQKYSMLGHLYLSSQIALEEITRTSNTVIQEKLMKPISFKQLDLFTGEVSPSKLAATARKTTRQFKNDYRLCSFCYLVEWRARKEMIEMACLQTPRPSEYKTIIDDNNCFKPCITHSMSQNSANLNTHLSALLRLQDEYQPNTDDEENSVDHLTDSEILNYATQHNILLTVSIDGSFDQHGIATTTICIVSPDIRESDPPNAEIWQNRPVILLLVRSWRLPKRWGAGTSSINIAELLGFILGAYTVPPNIPVLYVTDSNNARTLQCNVTNLQLFTHRKIVRKVKQGIDASIANHLEYLYRRYVF